MGTGKKKGKKKGAQGRRGGGGRRRQPPAFRQRRPRARSGAASTLCGPTARRFRWPGDTSATAPRVSSGAAPAPAAAPSAAPPSPIPLKPGIVPKPRPKGGAPTPPPAVDPLAGVTAFAAGVPRLAGGSLDALVDAGAVEAVREETEARVAANRPEPQRLVIQPSAPDRSVEDAARQARARSRGQLAGVVFLVAGLTWSAFIVEDVARDAEAQHWPTAQGTVTVCKSERVSSDPPRYEDHFLYRYKHRGQWHTGKRVRFAGGQGDPVKRYKVGQKVTVHIDPENSAVASLEPGVAGWAWAQLGVGLLAAVLGALYLVLGGRERRGV